MTSAGMTVAFADDVGTTLTAGDTYSLYMYAHTGTSSPGTTEYPLVQASSQTKCANIRDASNKSGVDVEWVLHCRLWTNRQNVEGMALIWKGITNASYTPHGCVKRDMTAFGMNSEIYFNINRVDSDDQAYTRICDFRTTFFQLSGYGVTIRWKYGVFDLVSECTSVCLDSEHEYSQATNTTNGWYRMVTTGCAGIAGGRPSSEFYRLGSCSVRVAASLANSPTVYEDASYAVVNDMVNQGTQKYVNDQLMIAINPDGTPSWALDLEIT